MAHERTGSFLGAIYVLVGAALLVSALFAPWYFYDGQAVQYGGGETSPIGSRDTSFFLTSVPWNAPVQATCPQTFPPGVGGMPGLCPISTSFSGAGFNSVGQVAGPTFALVAAGAAIAAVGGILGLILANAPRRRFPELILAVVAVALAIAATATFAVLLPGAFAHDIPASQRSYAPSGPWSSFFGSATYYIPYYCTPAGCPSTSASWGPGFGWALSVSAIMVLLVGAVMMFRFRHDVTEPVQPTVSAPGSLFEQVRRETMPSGRRGPAYAILSGIAVGAIVAILVLATSPAPAGYQWPPASQVEGYTVRFTEDGSVVRGGGGLLPSDCTRMLVDLNSTVPVTLWVTALAGASIPSNGTPPSIPSYYYWSGSAAVTNVSTVVAMTPPGGFWMVVYDGDEYPTGTASFGFWFSASDCPMPA